MVAVVVGVAKGGEGVRWLGSGKGGGCTGVDGMVM